MIFRLLKKFLIWLASFGNTAPAPRKPERRFCTECHAPIKRNHRWFYFETGTRHRDCSNPTLAPAPPQLEMEEPKLEA